MNFQPNGAARPILWANAAILGASFLLQRILLIVNGPTHLSATLYEWALAGLLAAIILALVLLRLGKPAVGMHVYALAGMVAVTVMAHGHITAGGESSSSLLLIFIPVGLVCISLALGWRVGRYYAIATGLLLACLGGMYGGPSETVIALGLSVIAAIVAREVGMLALEAQTEKAKRLALEADMRKVERAVEAFTNDRSGAANSG